ncbi:unnamed protein product [Phytophthora fragariaefolia]|uniref:Unnamed protein product n=1 Tax=Phytophthora fragariaefolia TaxID=1490495 RepID=A0A9W6Y3S2_9STRA|nr:unnamed protein product [Phytophthora fragariaefolia]
MRASSTTDVHIRALRTVAVDLNVDPFDGKNIKSWKVKMRAKLNPAGLLTVVTEKERYIYDWQDEVKDVWDQRWASAHAMIVAGLNDEIVIRMEPVIETGSPVRLWNELMGVYDGIPQGTAS